MSLRLAFRLFQMSEGRKTQVVLLDERQLEILIQVRRQTFLRDLCCSK